MDRISATIIMKDINSKNDGTHPRLVMTDVKDASEVAISESGGLTVYAISKGSDTVLMRIVSDAALKMLHAFRWVLW